MGLRVIMIFIVTTSLINTSSQTSSKVDRIGHNALRGVVSNG